jgi:NADH-quinone oxidoreductase subunit G
MNVVTESEKVKKAQDGVLEFLLSNHPLDCPVCDKGGECPLQDQALAHGSGESRFIEEKRHFEKPISIGAHVLLDRERCIQCSRCTRFAAEVAGDASITLTGRGDQTEIAPAPEHPFDSVFSGNTVQICPVGALTAKSYRFAARPWDLEQVESTCTGCAVGCRVAVQSSQNEVIRVLGVDSESVNQSWLCDKGRYGLGDGADVSAHLTSPRYRLRQPMIRRGGQLTPVSWSEALAEAARLVRSVDPDQVGVMGGASLTNEGAYAFARLAREVIGTPHLDAQYDDGLDAALVSALPLATINEAVRARVIVTITDDLRQSLPVLFLRLRSGARQGTLVQFVTGPDALSDVAHHLVSVRPGEVGSVVQGVLAGRGVTGTPLGDTQATTLRELLGEGEGVVVVVGRANVAEDPRLVEEAVRDLHRGLPGARFLVTLSRGNVRGALDMGLAPNVAPGRGRLDTPGRSFVEQLNAVAAGTQRVTLVLGDVLTNTVRQADAARALEQCAVVVVAGHGSDTLAYADVVLPATVGYERRGTVTNLEGRVSALAAKVTAPGAAWDDATIAAEWAATLGAEWGWGGPDAASAEIEARTGYPALSVLEDDTFDGVVIDRADALSLRRALDPVGTPGIRSAATVGVTSLAGTVREPAPATLGGVERPAMPDARPLGSLPAPDAYALRLVARRDLYDDGTTVGSSSALASQRRPARLRVHPLDLEHFALFDGQAVVARSARGDVFCWVDADDAVVRGTVVVPRLSRDLDGVDLVAALVEPDSAWTRVRVESR